MDFKKLFLAFLVKTLNKTEDEVAALIKADDNLSPEESLVDVFKEHTTHLNSVKEKSFNQGVSKERGEGLTKYEKEIAEHFGVDIAGKKGKDLVQAIIDAKADAKADGKTLTEEQILNLVKKHPYTLDLENKNKGIAAQKDQEWQEKLNAKDKEIARKATLDEVNKYALSLIEKNKFVFSSDAQRAATQKQILLDEYAKGNFEIKTLADGTKQFLVLKEDGSPLENELGHKIDINDYLLKIADARYDRAQSTQRQSPPPPKNNNGDNSQQQQQKYTGKVPKDQDELHTMMAKAPDAKSRLEIRTAFEQSQNQGQQGA